MERRRVDGVVASEPVDDERVVAALGAADPYLRRQPVDHDRRAAGGDRDVIVAGSAIDVHGVRLTVALAAARHRRKINGDLLRVCSGEVVDRDGVGATQSVELNLLDAVEIHDDVADVAR